MFATGFFDNVWNIFWIALMAVLVLLVINRRAVFTVFNIGRAKMKEGADALQKSQAVSLVGQALEDENRKIVANQHKIIELKGTLNTLTRQIGSDESELNILGTRIKDKLAEGKSDTDPDVVAVASQYSRIERSLANKKNSLVTNKSAYDTATMAVAASTEIIKDLEQKAEDAKTRLKASEIKRDATNLATSISNSDMSEVNRLIEAINQQADKNEATEGVAKDLGLNTSIPTAAERQRAVSSVLDRFRTSAPTVAQQEK